MSLRLRTLLILTLSIAIGTGFAAYIARVWLVDGFRSLEEQEAIRNMGRFRAALNQALEDLDRSTGDYSYWDDTYSFMQHQTKAYINANYGSDTLKTNHWDAVLLVDDQGGVVFSVGLDHKTNDVAAVPDYILSLAPNFRNDWRPTSGEGVFKGLIQTSDGPYMMAARRILPSSRKGEGRGNVVTFRRLAGSEFERIAQLTRLNVSLTAVHTDASLGTMGSKIEYPNEDDLIVKGNFDDVSKSPAFGVEINISRDIAKQGQKSIQMVLWGTFVIGCLILLSVILMIEKAILSRLSKLSSDVRHVTASADFHDRVGEFGDDELGQLGHDINDTLVSHEKMHDELVRERERAEGYAREKAVESEKMQTLVRTLSHDLSNHITVIGSYADILIAGAKDEKTSNMLRKIRRATLQQKEIIDLVRDMIALRDGKKKLSLTATALHECVEDCIKNLELLASRKSIHLSVQIDPTIYVAAEKRSLTQQVLSNITSNAIKFSDEGGSLKFRASQNGDIAELIVEDNGIGIPEDMLPKLFDPHAATTRSGTSGEPGTGFGMPVVKFYMAQYGGDVKVFSRDRSRHGKDASGTTFKLIFTKVEPSVTT